MKKVLSRLAHCPEQFIEFILDGDISLQEKVESVKEKMTHPFTHTYRRMKHLLHWIPTIWKDYDWDSVYLLIIMQKKLSDMAKYSEDQGHLMCSNKNAKEMRYLAHMLQRLIDDKYMEKELDAHYKKHPITWIENEPEKGWTRAQIVISNEDRDSYKRLMLKKEHLQKADLMKFSDLFRRKVMHYWD